MYIAWALFHVFVLSFMPQQYNELIPDAYTVQALSSNHGRRISH